MNSVHVLRWRILRERLERMAAAAERVDDQDGMRLALCCLALLERHTVNDKGRCRWCQTRRGWWLWSRRCPVVPVVAFYLEQPLRLITVAS